MTLARRLRLKKIDRSKRRSFTPSVHRPFYTPSDERALLRRVRQRRAEAEAGGGYYPVLHGEVTAIRQRCLPYGWLKPARKKKTISVEIDMALVESLLWLTGLQTASEVVALALADFVLRKKRKLPLARAAA